MKLIVTVVIFCLSCCFVGTAEANSVIDAINAAKLKAAHAQIDNHTPHHAVKSRTRPVLPLFNKLRKHYSLVVFYLSTCPHCKRFLPILKRFAKTYGFSVYPYTLTGKDLPSYPYSLDATTKVKQAFFSHQASIRVPSLFIVNNKTLASYLIGQGEMGFNDLYSQLLSVQSRIYGV